MNINHFEKLYSRYGPPRLLIDFFRSAILKGTGRLQEAMGTYEAKLDSTLINLLSRNPQHLFPILSYHSFTRADLPDEPRDPMDQMKLDELRDSMNPVNPTASRRFISQCFMRRITSPWIGMRVGIGGSTKRSEEGSTRNRVCCTS